MPPKRDIITHKNRKNHFLALRDNSYHARSFASCNCSDVLTMNFYHTTRWRQPAQECANNCALPTSVWSHNRRQFSTQGGETHIDNGIGCNVWITQRDVL